MRMGKINLFRYTVMFITLLLLNSLLLFLAGIWIYASLFPALIIVMIIYLLEKRHVDPLIKMEEGNPALEERLRAAYDNRGRDNVIVHSLIREVNCELNDLDEEAFINMRRVSTYVGVSVVVVFILLSLLFTGFKGFSLGALLGSGGGGGGDGMTGEGSGTGQGGGGLSGQGETQSSEETSIGQGPPKDIYGEPSIARIEGQDLELEMHPEYGEYGDFDMDGSTDRVEEIRSGFIQGTATESYTENIPMELESMVRKYFEKLTEEG